VQMVADSNQDVSASTWASEALARASRS
jgi:hypothetical protein